MASILEAEEDDDFYKTTYGGFNEEENDEEYHSENSESDDEDSDIDIDENDEVRSDMEDDEPKRKKRGAVSTKAYKEPAAKKEGENKKLKTEEKKSKPPPSIQIYHSSPEKKTLRKSTADRSKQREEREKERELKAKILKDIAIQKRVAEVRRLTQEELLEEAKITEELNLQSLENYRRLELEKKSRRGVKQAHKGPLIRYHSLTMPMIEEIPDDEEEEEKLVKKAVTETGEKCERTFITFTDERIMKNYFNEKRNKPPVRQFCPVTRLPAKYFDPITQTPYATVQAFKLIRDAYMQQLQNETPRKSRVPVTDSVASEIIVKS